MHAVARDVAEMPEPGAIRRARALHPRHREARDHAGGEERKLEARIRERRRFPDQKHERRKRHGVEQLDAAKERPRAQIEGGHQRGAKNRRAVLHHADVSRETRLSVTTLVTPIVNRSLRQSQKRKTTSAPTCSPATTST